MPKRVPKSSSSSKGAPPAAELELFAASLEALHLENVARDQRARELEAGLARALELLATSSARAENLLAAHKLLGERMDMLTLAVDEGIRHVDRAEKRIRATVGRARRELASHGLESPGIEAEASELSLIDAATGEVQGVHPVSADVVGDPDADQEDPLLGRLRELGLSR